MSVKDVFRESSVRKSSMFFYIVVLAVFLLVCLSGFFVYKRFFVAHQSYDDASYFYDMGEMLFNIRGKSDSLFLKLVISLELEKEAGASAVSHALPKVKDMIQIYLRQLSVNDFRGSVDLFRVKEALLLRLNKMFYPVKILDVLFQEILINE